MIEEYKEKIKIILENRLEFNIDNKKEIEIVHNWLACEWQLEIKKKGGYATKTNISLY